MKRQSGSDSPLRPLPPLTLCDSGGSPVLAPKSNAAPPDRRPAPLKVNLLQFRRNVSDLRMQLHQMRQLQARPLLAAPPPLPPPSPPLPAPPPPLPLPLFPPLGSNALLSSAQLQNQEALRVQLKRAEQEISAKLAEAMRGGVDDPIQRQRALVEEDRHKYLGLEERVLTQLG